MLSVRNVSFAWRHPALFEDIDLLVERGDRIGLLGRNGTGKSTLLKILAGQVEADHGEVVLAPGITVARLIQEVPTDQSGLVSEIVRLSWADKAGETDDDWAAEKAVDRVLSRMDLDPDAEFKTLSSGMKRRVLLAQSLVSEPDVLLLDEPTNHLDIESIAWLEKFLSGYHGALLFVTHDRVFLQALANRIVEIDRGRIFDWQCDYGTFLKRKQAAIDAEDKQNAEFDRKLAHEERWIRQGIKARRTRNEGRVRALQRMRVEFRDRRRDVGNVRMRALESDRSGQRVIETKNASFGYEAGNPIVKDFSTLITRGEKIGLIGPNGVGKTTLLKLLLGELPPDCGEVRLGANTKTIYFDQLREQLDEEGTVADNVGEGQEMLSIGGKQKHIYGYLQDFLFTPDRARQPVKFLSGGERNRLLLARLFKRSSNLLVLDEPTNDLDTETLELLEELVSNYAGTVLLVSHDRAFLNNVVTSTLALLGNGEVGAFAGGYDDFVRQRQASLELSADAARPGGSAPNSSNKGKAKAIAQPTGVKKLTFRERQELDGLPERIEKCESSIADLHSRMADPEFFKRGGDEITNAAAQIETLQAEQAELYARWEELESRNS